MTEGHPQRHLHEHTNDDFFDVGAMTTFPVSSANPELVARVAQNLAALHARIVSTGRELATIRIVAVTKTFGVEAVRAAAANGLLDVGENYVDELETKFAQSRDLDLSWYFLGPLQSNKIARVASCASVLCTVSRIKELEKIESGLTAPRSTCRLTTPGERRETG